LPEYPDLQQQKQQLINRVSDNKNQPQQQQPQPSLKKITIEENQVVLASGGPGHQRGSTPPVDDSDTYSSNYSFVIGKDKIRY